MAYIASGSLSVLASLMDSFLDILSQLILTYCESLGTSGSSAVYPVGASRAEPVGVVICAILMGMGSVGLIKESVQTIVERGREGNDGGDPEDVVGGDDMSPAYSIMVVILIKAVLCWYCKAVSDYISHDDRLGGGGGGGGASPSAVRAMYQDHLNDILSNVVAVGALVVATIRRDMWWVDPLGAIAISVYIMYSWYETGVEEIDKIVGRAASRSFVDELVEVGKSHHPDLFVDVCRCYHFGPRFLVEMEVVLPPDMLLRDTHDIGMSLQYKLENVPMVERAFVHIDYSKREYDEHVSSKQFRSYSHQQSADASLEGSNASSRLDGDIEDHF